MRLPDCAGCWRAHGMCHRPRRSRPCTRCKNNITDKSNGIQSIADIWKADPFPSRAIDSWVNQQRAEGFAIQLHTNGHYTDSWSIRCTSSTGRKFHFAFCNQDLFDNSNKPLVQAVSDGIRQSFSAKLNSSAGGIELVENAILIGGLAHYLCSTVSIEEQTEFLTNGEVTWSSSDSNDLGTGLMSFMAYRMGALVEETVAAIRSHTTTGNATPFGASAYAAAVILHREVDNFRNRLGCGIKTHCSSGAISLALLPWFRSLKQELGARIRLGCGLYPAWQSPILGSMKAFSTFHRTETIEMVIELKRHMTTPKFGVEDMFPEWTTQLGPHWSDQSTQSMSDTPLSSSSSPNLNSLSQSDLRNGPQLGSHTPGGNSPHAAMLVTRQLAESSSADSQTVALISVHQPVFPPENIPQIMVVDLAQIMIGTLENGDSGFQNCDSYAPYDDYVLNDDSTISNYEGNADLNSFF